MISDQIKNELRNQFLHPQLKASQKPLLFAMAGIPAAGKTTYLQQKKHNNELPGDHYYHNPDHVMRELPGYMDDHRSFGAEATTQTWESPARILADEIFFPEALDRSLNIVMDMGLCREEILQMVQECRNAGYFVHLNIIYCDLQTAQARSKQRDRHVAQNTIKDRAVFLAGNIERILMLSDQITALDNSNLDSPFAEITIKDVIARILEYESKA